MKIIKMLILSISIITNIIACDKNASNEGNGKNAQFLTITMHPKGEIELIHNTIHKKFANWNELFYYINTLKLENSKIKIVSKNILPYISVKNIINMFERNFYIIDSFIVPKSDKPGYVDWIKEGASKTISTPQVLPQSSAVTCRIGVLKSADLASYGFHHN